MTVTGRTYTSTRPRGFAPWNPQAKTRVLLAEVEQQLDLWSAQHPLTGRQIYYGMIGRGVIDKNEAIYAKILDILNRGRRAGMIPWTAIRDDGPTLHVPHGYDGAWQFLSTVNRAASVYRRNRQDGQAVFIEVWCEAGGMVPQLIRAADEFGVPVSSSGGFDSVTVKHQAAERFIERDVPTIVLHIGDYDPSGCSIIDSAAEDITAFCDYTAPGIVQFRRLAVTPDQIIELGLPTAPPKADQKCGETMTETVQAEAIPPDVIASLVVDEITSLMDMDIYHDLLDAEAAERADLVARIGEADL